MRIFLSVVEEGSFTKASIRHNVSQPATTIAINQIEDILGVDLFKRAGSVRQSVLTEQGKEVASVFSQLVQTHDEMMGEIDFASNMSKPKRIVVQRQYTDAFSSEWIETLVRIFDSRNITISTDDRDGVIDAITKREGDVGLVDGYIDSDLVDYLQIASEAIGLLVHKDNANQFGNLSQMHWADLPEHVMLLTQINSGALNKMRAIFRRHSVDTKNFIETDSMNILAQMLGDSQRVAILPKCCAGNMLLDEAFRFIPLADPAIEIPIGFATPRGYTARASFSKFVSMSRDIADAQQDESKPVDDRISA